VRPPSGLGVLWDEGSPRSPGEMSTLHLRGAAEMCERLRRAGGTSRTTLRTSTSARAWLSFRPTTATLACCRLLHQANVVGRPVGEPGVSDNLAECNWPEPPGIIGCSPIIPEDENVQWRDDGRAVVAPALRHNV
jgi:hypothetical protein